MTTEDLPQFDLTGVSSYEEAHESLEWDLPENFNMGTAVIDRHAGDRGRVALFWENVDGANETWTFWELRKRCNQFGNLVRDLGIKTGDVVGVHVPQSPETVIAHAGLWRAGSVSIPLPYTYEIDSLRYRLDDAGATALVVQAEKFEAVRGLLDELPALEHLIVVGAVEGGDGVVQMNPALNCHSTSFDPVETTPDDTSAIFYTSGTTGEPKGGVHGHRFLIGHLPGYQVIYNFNLEGVYYTPADWGWGGGLIDLVTAALYNGQPVLGFNRGPFEPAEQLELLEKYQVTHTFMPPTALNMLRDVDDSDYDLSLEVVVAGGEALSTAAHEWATERDIVINEFYGQTEANFLVANCEALWGSKSGSMGRAMPGRDVDVVDENGIRLEAGEVGEVALRNPETDPLWFKGYLNKPEETASVRLGDWHLTEDLAEKDEDGFFWYKSRKDDVIISSGYRISPISVEDAIMKHDAVVESAVIGAPHDIRGEVVKAFVRLTESTEPSDDLREGIQNMVKANLAKHEYPREIEFVDEFPTTESGKIRRTALREDEHSS
jgi:acetyl-CoA synthetase